MIPTSVLESTFDSMLSIYGSSAIYHFEDKDIFEEVIFEKNPLLIDVESGMRIIGKNPRMTAKFSESALRLTRGISVTVNGTKYDIQSVAVDETRRQVVCELAKTKN